MIASNVWINIDLFIRLPSTWNSIINVRNFVDKRILLMQNWAIGFTESHVVVTFQRLGND